MAFLISIAKWPVLFDQKEHENEGKRITSGWKTRFRILLMKADFQAWEAFEAAGSGRSKDSVMVFKPPISGIFRYQPPSQIVLEISESFQ